ncbi:hypothetical protein [Chelativorans sp. AA-79]|uniref:hypothetical protein n=1 Tax=Chelativorans sp. AA-79 TaxID=3028735 RepID=UPI0023F8D70F|nr:hypothetical protein [Chelativorans sp. AA-79]WEX09169.1 hypothetical protein PVE73_24570 [Chelativorans sp. AA-79]
MPTEPKVIRPAPQRVYVAIYEHRHGTDVRVFADEAQAMCWRTGLAKEWWSDAFEDDPPPDDAIGEAYFERMLERDEFFSTMQCEVEAGDHRPTDPADLGSISGTERSA